jgi:hypothetical protein
VRKVHDWLWIPNHSVGPDVLVPGLDWGREPLVLFGTKQNCSTFRTQLGGRWGGHPHLALASFPPPPRTSAGHFSPLVPPSFPSSSHFENPSHFPLPLLQCIYLPNPPPQLAPAHPVFARDSKTAPPIQLAKATFFNPSSSSFHEHITNEQLHDSESARHTLNPTGARERARRARRSQLSFCEEGPTPTPECRCHCRRRRPSTLQPSGFPPLDVQTRQPSTRCLAQAWQSCHPRQHQHRPPGRPHSPQRENTSASFATGPSAGASTGADMNGLVC